VPGLSPITFSDAALARIKARKTPPVSWFLDVSLLTGYWSGQNRRAYHHTAPINAIYALHESLTILKEEGLENAWARHRRHHGALKAGLETLGLEFVVEEPYRLPQLNAVSVPEGVDEAQVRTMLLMDHSLEIGAGLGSMAGKIWRIGLMGYSAREENVLKCVSAMESVLAKLGRPVEPGAAASAAKAAYKPQKVAAR
jgi:alanine-glyoxylate transaminase/serine-glyoxylate transaminase/serine-pyruvate transaminase